LDLEAIVARRSAKLGLAVSLVGAVRAVTAK
jgi:hypothetical protein